jgi:hypothetical protein
MTWLWNQKTPPRPLHGIARDSKSSNRVRDETYTPNIPVICASASTWPRMENRKKA